MKRKELYQALIDGKTLMHKNGQNISIDSPSTHTFLIPSDWSIKGEPKMYCRFKHLMDGWVNITSYIEVDSKGYKEHIDKGHIEMVHKTLDEIE